MLQRLLAVRDRLEQMVVSDEWKANATSCTYAEDCEETRKTILNGGFWEKVELVLTLTEKIVQLLRLVDSDKACTGKVYWRYYEIQEHLNNFTELQPSFMQPIQRAVAARWDDLHSPLHSVGYILDPEFWDHDQGSIENVMQDWFDVVEKLEPDVDNQAKIIDQLEDYRSKLGTFGREAAQVAAKSTPAHKWWALYGASTPELR